MATSQLITEVATSKRKDPSFTKITADIPKETARRVRIISAFIDVSLSDVVEEALQDWIEKKQADHKFEL